MHGLTIESRYRRNQWNGGLNSGVILILGVVLKQGIAVALVLFDVVDVDENFEFSIA